MSMEIKAFKFGSSDDYIENILLHIKKTLESGYLMKDTFYERLEKKLAEVTDQPKAFLTSDEMSSFAMIYEYLKDKKGIKTIAVQSNLLFHCIFPAYRAGLKVEFFDCNPENGAPDVESLEKLLSKKKIDCVVYGGSLIAVNFILVPPSHFRLHILLL